MDFRKLSARRQARVRHPTPHTGLSPCCPASVHGPADHLRSTRWALRRSPGPRTRIDTGLGGHMFDMFGGPNSRFPMKEQQRMSFHKTLSSAVVLSLLCLGRTWPQTNVGQISGKVFDSSGAVVPYGQKTHAAFRW